MLIIGIMNNITNIKALIFDLDGTLLTSNKSIAPKTLESLLYLKKKGMKIIIATGRPPKTALFKLGDLDLITTMVCANGACLYNPFEKRPLREVPVLSSSVERILKIAKDTNKNALVYTLEHTYVSEKALENYLKLSDAKESKEVFASILPLESFNLDNELVYKCIINDKSIGYNTEFLNYLTTNVVDLTQKLFITHAHPDYLEIMDEKINKYDSLLDVLKSLNIKEEEVIAFGDGVNDIEMLDKFCYSVAMDNASNEVKEAATFSTDSNDEEGIYKFLKNNNLI
jgi:Cof subfamily protein (haloacid dehalogenase superfamily)